MASLIEQIDNDSILSGIYRDYSLIAPQLSSAQRIRAEKSITDMMAIDRNLDKLSAFKSDAECNGYINILTKSGAEDGFSANQKVLASRIELFGQTYLKAKGRGDLNGFFSCFAQGDPCLSGRMESLYKYAASLDDLHIDQMTDPEKSLFLPGTIFAEVMMNHFEDGSVTLEKFSSYLQMHISDMARMFKKQEGSSTAAAFLDYLKVEGLDIKGDDVKWEELLMSVLNSRCFPAIYQQSLRYVI